MTSHFHFRYNNHPEIQFDFSSVGSIKAFYKHLVRKVYRQTHQKTYFSKLIIYPFDDNNEKRDCYIEMNMKELIIENRRMNQLGGMDHPPSNFRIGGEDRFRIEMPKEETQVIEKKEKVVKEEMKMEKNDESESILNNNNNNNNGGNSKSPIVLPMNSMVNVPGNIISKNVGNIIRPLHNVFSLNVRKKKKVENVQKKEVWKEARESMLRKKKEEERKKKEEEKAEKKEEEERQKREEEEQKKKREEEEKEEERKKKEEERKKKRLEEKEEKRRKEEEERKKRLEEEEAKKKKGKEKEVISKTSVPSSRESVWMRKKKERKQKRKTEIRKVQETNNKNFSLKKSRPPKSPTKTKKRKFNPFNVSDPPSPTSSKMRKKKTRNSQIGVNQRVSKVMKSPRNRRSQKFENIMMRFEVKKSVNEVVNKGKGGKSAPPKKMESERTNKIKSNIGNQNDTISKEKKVKRQEWKKKMKNIPKPSAVTKKMQESRRREKRRTSMVKKRVRDINSRTRNVIEKSPKPRPVTMAFSPTKMNQVFGRSKLLELQKRFGEKNTGRRSISKTDRIHRRTRRFNVVSTTQKQPTRISFWYNRKKITMNENSKIGEFMKRVGGGRKFPRTLLVESDFLGKKELHSIFQNDNLAKIKDQSLSILGFKKGKTYSLKTSNIDEISLALQLENEMNKLERISKSAKKMHSNLFRKIMFGGDHFKGSEEFYSVDEINKKFIQKFQDLEKFLEGFKQMNEEKQRVLKNYHNYKVKLLKKFDNHDSYEPKENNQAMFTVMFPKYFNFKFSTKSTVSQFGKKIMNMYYRATNQRKVFTNLIIRKEGSESSDENVVVSPMELSFAEVVLEDIKGTTSFRITPGGKYVVEAE